MLDAGSPVPLVGLCEANSSHDGEDRLSLQLLGLDNHDHSVRQLHHNLSALTLGSTADLMSEHAAT